MDATARGDACPGRLVVADHPSAGPARCRRGGDAFRATHSFAAGPIRTIGSAGGHLDRTGTPSDRIRARLHTRTLLARRVRAGAQGRTASDPAVTRGGPDS